MVALAVAVIAGDAAECPIEPLMAQAHSVAERETARDRWGKTPFGWDRPLVASLRERSSACRPPATVASTTSFTVPPSTCFTIRKRSNGASVVATYESTESMRHGEMLAPGIEHVLVAAGATVKRPSNRSPVVTGVDDRCGATAA